MSVTALTVKRLPEPVRQAVDAGYSVVPCDTAGKPLVAWKRWVDTPQTAEEIAGLPSGDVWAIVTGQRYGLILADFDGPEGRDTFNKLGLPEHVTSRSGGVHVYLAHPGFEVKSATKPFPEVLPGLDIKGEGSLGYFLGYRADSKSAGEYQPGVWPPAPVDPGPLVGVLDSRRRDAQPSAAPKSRLDLDAVWAGIPEGQRQDKLHQFACFLFGRGDPRWMVEDLVYGAAARCTPPYGDVEDLERQIDRAEEYIASGGHLPAWVKQFDPMAEADDKEPRESSWRFVNLKAALAGDRPPPPDVFPYPGGAGGLFYSGLCHAINGESESGKSWLALAACASEMGAGRNVVYLDFEDGPEDVVGRLVSLGLDSDTILTRFHYVRPDESLAPRDAEHLAERLAELRPAVVVIDGVTEAMAAEGLDPRHEKDVAAFIRHYPRFCQRHSGRAAIVQIDHVTKNKDSRGKDALGSQHKRAGLQVTYTVDPVFEFGRGRHGKAKVTVTKDRRGWVRGASRNGKQVGHLHVVSAADEDSVKVYVVADEDGAEFRPTRLMQRVSEALAAAGKEGLSRNQIEQLKGNKEHLYVAGQCLVREGFAFTNWRGGHLRYFHSRPFEDDGAEPVV